MNNITVCAAKKRSILALEWDRLAQERHRQIASGEDLSFEHILVPTTLRLLEKADTTLVLDVGSGTGDLTARLAGVASSVVGIEPSGESVSIARKNCCAMNNVRFIQTHLEDSVTELQRGAVTAAVAGMTLMTSPDLTSFAESLAVLLKVQGHFIATVTHPWFWPKYWEYEEEKWFRYQEEIFIEAPFRISRRCTDVITTHIHRPLEQYIHTFSRAGFNLDTLVEPMPSPKIQSYYPRPWRFPRFLGLRWSRAS